MKRSEMVLKLMEILVEFDQEDTMHFENYCSRILFRLENAGMLPPETTRYTDLPMGKTLCNPENRWEEE